MGYYHDGMPSLRIGLIGYGSWARSAYVPALRADPRAEIVAAAAPSARTQARIREELGAEVAVFDDYQTLLDGAPVDAVLIGVQNSVHENAIRAALRAGIPLLYEPPICTRPDRIRALLKEIVAAPQVTHADLELSYLPVLRRAAELLAAGAIGSPRTASITLKGEWDPTAKAELCLTHELAPWYVDPLNRLLDRRPSRVLVLDGRGRSGRMQPYAIAHFDYDGVWGTFNVNLAQAGDLHISAELQASEGEVMIDPVRGALRWRTRADPEWRSESVPAIQPHASWAGMHECVRAFLDSIESGRSSQSGSETIAALHMIGLAAEESVDSGTWARVPEPAEL